MSAARRQHTFPPIPVYEWARVRQIVSALASAAPAGTRYLLAGLDAGSPAKPHRIQHFAVTAIRAARRSGIVTHDRVPGPEGYAPGTRQTSDRLVRFFFAAPSGCAPIPPIETVERRERVLAHVFDQYRGRRLRWEEQYRAYLHRDGTWQEQNPRVTVDCNGAMLTIIGERLEGTVSYEVPCNEKCTSATGPKCECSCGGENHGSNRVVEVWHPRSEAEQHKLAMLYSGATPEQLAAAIVRDPAVEAQRAKAKAKRDADRAAKETAENARADALRTVAERAVAEAVARPIPTPTQHRDVKFSRPAVFLTHGDVTAWASEPSSAPNEYNRDDWRRFDEDVRNLPAEFRQKWRDHEAKRLARDAWPHGRDWSTLYSLDNAVERALAAHDPRATQRYNPPPAW